MGRRCRVGRESVTAAPNGICKPHGSARPTLPASVGTPYLAVPIRFEITLALVLSMCAWIILATISGSFTPLMSARATSAKRSRRTRAMPACRMPRTSAATVEMSIMRPRANGPRSTMTTVTSRPLSRL
jgi:hypothetical protein